MEASYSYERDEVHFTGAAAFASGQVIELPDGRAGVIQGGGAGYAIGDAVIAKVAGVHTMAKTADIVLLDGQKVYWVRSTNKTNYTGDFVAGTVRGDAAAAATTVDVDLNVLPNYLISLDQGEWVEEATDGLGVTKVGAAKKLAFDAVAEVAQAALYSLDTIAVARKPILEAWAAIYDIGNNAALDISLGLATGSHATDFDSVTEAVLLHLDGSALSILAESVDGTTEVAATDTLVDAVDDVYFFVQIDCRDLADIQIYINGVLMLTASVFKLDAATGPLVPIAHLEKTSDDTLADLRVKELNVRAGVMT